MNLCQLIARDLKFHRRGNGAVILGAAVSAAILIGALLIGDSVRGSLRHLTLDRLGRVDHALVSDHFFREQLAVELEQAGAGKKLRVAPAILLRGTVSNAATHQRAGKVTVLGVTDAFWALGKNSPKEGPTGREVILNDRLASEIGVSAGDSVLIRVLKPSLVHRESALGNRDDLVGALRLKVKKVIPSEGVGRFGLVPNQQLPRNAYVSLKTLQNSLEQIGKANALFAGTTVTERPGTPPEDLRALLKRTMKLEDIELSARSFQGKPYFSVESARLVLSPPAVDALIRFIEGRGLDSLPVYTYLANEIALTRGQEKRSIPYSTITGMNIFLRSSLPPFEMANGRKSRGPATATVYLNEWAASQLGARKGDSVHISYFALGKNNDLITRTKKLKVSGIVKMTGLAGEPGLTPKYPGIENAKTMADWDPPFPVDLKKIRPRDEAYWREHRTTPKAFVPLITAQELWKNRFGNLTSVFIRAPDEEDSAGAAAKFETGLLQLIEPARFNMAFQPIKKQGLHQSKGATDFGGLFIGFSLFLIVSAAVLVGLLFRLNVEGRSNEIGLLLAVGFPLKTVRRIFLTEGMILAGIGGLIGMGGALGYAWLLLVALKTIWVQAIGSPFLNLYITPLSLAIGFISSFLVVLFAIWRTVRRLGRVAPQSLLAGARPENEVTGLQTPRGKSSDVALAAAVCALGFLGAAASGAMSKTIGFFAGGSLLLVAFLAFFSWWLRRERGGMVHGSGLGAILRLGARNGTRHPGRSVLTASLVASATFIIIAVAANHQNPSRSEPEFNSGDGGFALIAESDLPIYVNLDTEKGRAAVGLANHRQLRDADIFSLRLKPGEDISCLNLYQPTRPTVLGVPGNLIARGGFHFQKTIRPAKNPWQLLRDQSADRAVPVFGDADTMMWIFKKMVGQDFPMISESGTEVQMRVSGLLKHCVFQSEVLISEDNFRRLFPSQEGYRAFLIAAPKNLIDKITADLEDKLSDYGFDAVKTGDRLAGYLAVQNTYLSTFQTLGGLGLLLGTFGLGTVLLRNVLERRAELAMLKALGFRSREIAGLVLAENTWLLVFGLLAGTISALLAVGPHLLAGGLEVPWGSLAGILLLVAATGTLAGLVAVRASLKTEIVPALRGE